MIQDFEFSKKKSRAKRSLCIYPFKTSKLLLVIKMELCNHFLLCGFRAIALKITEGGIHVFD